MMVYYRIQNSRIQMVKYKSLENIPFKYNLFKKHPPKLAVSYSVMLGCWFGGMRMGLRWGGGVDVFACSLSAMRPYRVWYLYGGDGYGLAVACILRFFVARMRLVQ